DSLSDKAEIDSGYNPLLPLRTVYVDNAKADDSGDGLSPANAKKTVSGALAVSENAGYENEIVLAAGTYSGTLNRDLEFGTFNLIIRSASGAANTIINLESSGQFLYLYCPARIEGLTISNGYIENYDGGAIYATDYEVTVKDCVFNSNETSDYGGALSIEYGIANIINCQFTNNCSWAFGAVWLRNNSDVLISNCEFNWNVALLSKGGAVGIDVNYNTTEVYNCKFIENEADTDCGALYMITHEDATLNVTNCLFAENVANNGDIYIDGYTTLNLLNSTIIKSASNVPTCRVNTAAIANMQNNILIGSFVEFGTINADSNCCPNDLSSYGDGNITASPLLDSNYCLTENSPCIDIGIAAGAPDEDLVGVERPQGSGIDFGCYEFKNSFTDSDNDGMDDAWEMEHFGNLDQTANGDYDNDGATNLEEFIHNTNPASYSDVDSDGMSDDWEKVHFGGSSSQTATGDYDSDGVSNLMEYLLGRKPEKAAVNDSATVQLKIFTQLN
ncbi:MAG: right-handed parallel beta-helix repeat-containing protein, partial [Victivallaceae bacterium]